MKKTTFITTFSSRGYEAHGKHWIQTFIENTTDVYATIFVDFELPSPDPRIEVLNFDHCIPQHKTWVNTFKPLHKDDRERGLGVTFSYKAFVMMYALHNMSDYVVWLDSDCVFKKNVHNNFAEKSLHNKFIAIQVDKVAINDIWKTEEHAESGIVVFDMNHPDKNKFLNKFEEMYDPIAMSKMVMPYDGFVIRRACREIDFIDLFPKDYTMKTLDSGATFIHPELQQRFVHNIGNKGY